MAIFEVEVDDRIRIDQNRKGLRDIAAKHIDQNITHGALVFFYSKNQTDYRFSFIAKWSEIDLDTGEFVKGETKPKRFTYLLGGNESCTTAAKRLLELAHKKEKGDKIKLNTVMETFSVEPLKKDFFKSYKEHYNKFWQYIAEPENGYRDILLDETKENKDKQEKPIRDFVKKLLGRIVFLHFLQKKGWMGCPANIDTWEGGEKQFLQVLYKDFDNKEKFHSQCLTNLFFNTLNTRRENDIFSIDGLSGKLNGSRVPYLNGGLFEADKPEDVRTIDFPVKYFDELFEFFAQYNFTIDENSPDDHEVGIDPEMLGHIFENLLEENREKGAFYTPKEIVEYMCKESVIQYLKNHFPEEAGIENFVRNHQVSAYFANRDNASALNQKLDAIKVCDPAIGSGAFPIGILNELFEAKKFIYPHLNTKKEFNPAKVKKDIIQNSIYGVDIEKGAVDIAQLRFWLALVVDEIQPQPLPNLDYKIMQGNSLLESFEGIDLDKLMEGEDSIIDTEKGQLTLGPEFEKPIRQLTIFDNVTKQQLWTLIDKFYDPIDWEMKTGEKVDKSRIKIAINEIIEGKIHSFVLSEKRKLEKEIDQKIQLWNIQNEDYSKLNQKSKDFKQFLKTKKKLEKLNNIELELINLHSSEEKPFFLWHTWFKKEVFDNGGFDIMIGNPPYIQLQRDSGVLADLYSGEGFETLQRTGDIYVLFYEKGIQLLKSGGHLTFITSNKWMRANYGKSLRKFFCDYKPIKLLDLGAGIFENATVDTNIMIIEKTKTITQNLKAAIINGKQNIVNLSESDYSTLSNLDENSWVILSPQEQNIKQLIENVGTPLKDWDIEINYGIKTGYNEAFIISGDKKDELIAADPKSAEIIKPLLRGRDIKKYKVEFADLWLIGTFPALNLNINDYPAIKDYLAKFLPKLKQTGETFIDKNGNKQKTRKKTGNKWFETQDQISYYEHFEKEKIVYREISTEMNAIFDDQSYFLNNKLYIITGEFIKFLVSILNSLLFTNVFLSKANTTGGKGVVFLNKIPIPKIPCKDQIPFETLVDYVIFLKNPANANLSEKVDNEQISLFFEDVIDGCVFELYFGQHMKEKGINILDMVTGQVQSIEDKDEKEAGNIILSTWLQMRNSEIAERMRLFTVKSPDILKPIIQS